MQGERDARILKCLLAPHAEDHDIQCCVLCSRIQHQHVCGMGPPGHMPGLAHHQLLRGGGGCEGICWIRRARQACDCMARCLHRRLHILQGDETSDRLTVPFAQRFMQLVKHLGDCHMSPYTFCNRHTLGHFVVGKVNYSCLLLSTRLLRR